MIRGLGRYGPAAARVAGLAPARAPGHRQTCHTARPAAERLAEATAVSDQLARAHALLADEASKQLYLEVLAWRVLGSWHVRLPVTARQYRDAWARAEAGRLGTETFRGPGGSVEVEPGDVVVDGGAAFGDTALAFAQRTGGGHVHSIERIRTTSPSSARTWS